MIWQRMHIIGTLLCLTVCVSPGCESLENESSPRLYAASSTRDIVRAIQKVCPVQFEVTFAGSQTLALQIHHGAPADAVLSAAPHHMDWLDERGHLRKRHPFATNSLQVVQSPVAFSGRGPIDALSNAKSIVLGVPDSPIGLYSARWLELQHDRGHQNAVEEIRAKVVSYESNTRLVLQRILRHEADAAIVYRSDTHAFPNLRTIAIPRSETPDIVLTFAWLTGTEVEDQVRHQISDCFIGDHIGPLLLNHGLGMPR